MGGEQEVGVERSEPADGRLVRACVVVARRDEARAGAVVDAVAQDGVYDRAGERLIPPRYYDARAYEATIRRVRALDADLLLTAHYDVMDRPAARDFLDRSLAFVDAVRDAVRSAQSTDLRTLTQEIDRAVGPFPSFTHELAASVRAHLDAPPRPAA